MLQSAIQKATIGVNLSYYRTIQNQITDSDFSDLTVIDDLVSTLEPLHWLTRFSVDVTLIVFRQRQQYSFV